MDRELIDAFRLVQRQAVLDQHTRFLDGFVAALSFIADMHDAGRLTDECVQDIRDHVALHREFSA